MLGLICWIISALLFFFFAIDVLESGEDEEFFYVALGLIPLGHALAGVALPNFTINR